MFTDRIDAGRQLAEELLARGFGPDAVVLGIPRGGVVVAAEVARLLGAPLDVVAAAKVASPGSPEYAIGAVAPDGEVAASERSGYTADQVRSMAGPALAKSSREVEEFRGGSQALAVAGRTAIVVDDGLATGLTALAAVGFAARQGAASVVLAVPVAAPDSLRMLAPHVEELVVLEVPEWFSAVGQFYSVFGQTGDDEVKRLLTKLRERPLA